MIWNLKFVGRKTGAIGIRYWTILQIEADTKEEAELKLYDRYEHIGQLTIEKELEQ